jgi:hypothetical protein
MTPLSAQPAGGSFVARNSARHDTAAAAPAAAKSLHKPCDRGIRLYAKAGQRFIAQNAFVGAMQAAHHDDEIGLPHAKRLAAAGLSRLTLGKIG